MWPASHCGHHLTAGYKQGPSGPTPPSSVPPESKTLQQDPWVIGMYIHV